MVTNAPVEPQRPDANDLLLMAELTRDEADRQFPYDDATGKAPDSKGKITIGIGRNLTDVGLTADERQYLLWNDVKRVKVDLDRNAPWWRSLDPVRQRVIQNMCFNLGWPRLSGFRNTLAAMKAGDWDRAAIGMLASLWASQVGSRAKRLAQMMRTGKA